MTMPENGSLDLYDKPISTSISLSDLPVDVYFHAVRGKQVYRKRGKMRISITTLFAVVAVGIPAAGASADATKSPQFRTLPPLREQASIVDGWTKERKALVPGILRKYNVDAWLVRFILMRYTSSSFKAWSH